MDNQTSAQQSRPRYHLLDLLRGFLFINMAAYHFLYDWVFIFGQNCPFMYTQGAYIWQQTVCSGFILLAGFCCTLSRKPAKNGIKIFLCAILVTVVTWIVTPQERILFGILHFMGLAYLITAGLMPLFKKIPNGILFTISLILFAFTRGIYYGYLGIFQIELIPLPDSLYQYPLLFLIGLPDASFVSGDYFPLVPWLFLFWTGCAIATTVKQSRLFKQISYWQFPIFNWMGRNCLILYMLHQPIIFGVLSVIFL